MNARDYYHKENSQMTILCIPQKSHKSINHDESADMIIDFALRTIQSILYGWNILVYTSKIATLIKYDRQTDIRHADHQPK